MSLQHFAVSSRRSLFCLALVLILAVGAVATGIGIVFQGFETDTSLWFNSGYAQEIFQEPSGYTDGSGGYASGVASATGNHHARLVVDPNACFDDGGSGAPVNNDCEGPFTNWDQVYVYDGVTTLNSNTITSNTANFTAAQVGLGIDVYDSGTGDPVFAPGTTITAVTNSTTAMLSGAATESTTNADVVVTPVFTSGYITQADIYLDTAWAAGNADLRFDLDSPIWNYDFTNYLSDYVFNVGTQVSGDSTPGFWVSTSPNAFRNSTYPENPCPVPANDGIGNYCRVPYKITTSGWYTFRHIFKIDPSSQNLSIEFQVLPQSGTPIVDTTIYGWQGNAQAPTGGIIPAGDWFANMEIPELAIDDTLLKDFDTLALTPTNPGIIGPGTSQTFTLAASLFGTADPLTPGLTPANVAFTHGNSDTGTVTLVPSGTQPGNGTFSYVATGGTSGSVNLTANIETSASNTVSFNVIPPTLYSPVNGSTLPSSSVTFEWTEYPGATAYWLDVGATPGGNNYAQSGSLSSSTLSYLVNSLPANGSTVYATWYYYVGGNWQHSSYSYTAFGGNTSKGVLISPMVNSTLPGTSATFTWTAGSGATAYWLDAGNVSGGNQYFQSGNLGNVLSTTVSGLPSNGSFVYVTLYSLVSGVWLYNEYTFAAYNSAAAGVMSSPPGGSILPGSTVTFIWAAGTRATAYWVDIGPVPNGNTYEQSGNIGNVTQLTVNGLPTDGSAVFLNLYSLINGSWQYNSYTYTAFTAGTGNLAVMQTPTPGTTLSGNPQTFTWSPGLGATAYWLDLGTTPGGNTIYQSGNLGTALSTTVSTLPENGATVYATLYSLVGGQWLYNSYTYGSAIAFQGFEVNTGDWDPTYDSNGDPITTTFRVASGSGILGLQSADGNYYAEVHNIDNDYEPGYFGDSAFTLFGFATPPAYPGDFSQSIKMYVNASWPVALYGGPGVWIDEQPGNFTTNSGGEHNFRLTPTGTSVEVYIDGQPSIATITTSGWYNFKMTFQRTGACANPNDLVTTVMSVYDANGNVVGTPTTVCANSPGGPLNTENLMGPGYLWITVWPNGWAGDVLGFDDARADLL